MFKAVKITLILASLLFLAIQLLFSLSYETFIPWDSDFGEKIYIIYIFFLWISTEKYFYSRIKEKDFNYSLYAAFPAVLVIVNIIITLVIFSIFKLPRTGGHGDFSGILLLISIVYQSIAFIIYGIFRVGAFHGFASNVDSIFIETAKFINNLLKKLSIIIIPLLITLITATVILAFNDYLSGGIKYKFSDKPNNKPMLKLALKNNDLSFCDKIKGQKYLVGGFWYRDAIELQKGCIHSFIYDIPEIKNTNKKNSKVGFFHTYKKLEKHCSKTKFQKECAVTLLKSMNEILESNTQDSIKTSNSFVDTSIKVSAIKNGFGDVKGDYSTQYLMIKIKHKTRGYPADDFEFDYPVPGYDYPMYEYDVETISDTLNAFKRAQVTLKSDLKAIQSVVEISDSISDKKRLSTTVYIDIEDIKNAEPDFEKIVTTISKRFSKQRKQSIPKNADRRRRPCERTEGPQPRMGISFLHGVPKRVDINFQRMNPICIDGKLVPRIKK